MKQELLRIGAFRRIVIARGFSALASWAVILASSYLVLRLTEDPVAVGVLALAKGLPSLLLTSYGGSLADRFDPTRVIAISYAVRAIAIGALAVGFWLGAAGLVAIYLATAVAGCGAALAKASVAALVVAPVPEHLHERAIVVTSLTYSVGAIIGPLFAGSLLAVGGIGTSFLVSALALLVVAGLVLVGIQLDPANQPTPCDPISEAPAQPKLADSADTLQSNWWQNLRAALADPRLRPAFVGVGILAAGALPVLSLAAVIANQYGKSPILLEIILAAAGIGALLCNLVLMRVTINHVHRIPLAAASFVVTAIAIALAATAPTIAVEAVAFALLAASANLLWVMMSSVIQTESPAAARGRMNGIFYTLASAGTSIGALLMAELMNLIGVPSALLAYAAVLLVIGVMAALRRDNLAQPQ